jgi:hypothetical protein
MVFQKSWKGVVKNSGGDGGRYSGRREAPGTPGRIQLVGMVPVTGRLVECPVCHGGVRVIKAPFTDIDSDIHSWSRLYGNHSFGGGKTTRNASRCAGSSTLVKP